MNLINRIKAQQVAARKNGNKEVATILTTLVGEASMPGLNDGKRDSTDEEVLAVIRKFIKNINECLSNLSGDAREAYENELVILNLFLPQQLTDEELVEVIRNLIGVENLTSKGELMKCLKNNYSGRYDGKKASTAIDFLLAS